MIESYLSRQIKEQEELYADLINPKVPYEKPKVLADDKQPSQLRGGFKFGPCNPPKPSGR